jgi:hypothetical protein
LSKVERRDINKEDDIVGTASGRLNLIKQAIVQVELNKEPLTLSIPTYNYYKLPTMEQQDNNNHED